MRYISCFCLVLLYFFDSYYLLDTGRRRKPWFFFKRHRFSELFGNAAVIRRVLRQRHIDEPVGTAVFHNLKRI